MTQTSRRDKEKKSSNQDGQVLIEFLLLLAAIILISFSTLRLVNSSIADRWTLIGNRIIGPSPSPNDNPNIEPIKLR